MKISTKPTEHILVRANCQSEWDCCDFALITCDNHWKDGIRSRLKAIDTFDAPDNFISFRFYDNSVEFYQSGDNEVGILSEGKEWDFVILDEEDKDSFDKPENRLGQILWFSIKTEPDFTRLTANIPMKNSIRQNYP